MGKQKKPTPQEYSIARALKSFGGVEEAQLCAFLEEMEQARLAGVVAGWRITRVSEVSEVSEGCRLDVMLIDGRVLTAIAATFRDAGKELSKELIADAMHGAPDA